MSGPRSRRAWSALESNVPLSSKERILTFCMPGYANEQACVTIRVLDTFISAVRYMEGGPVQPWWHFTRERQENRARWQTLMSAGSVRNRVDAVGASRARGRKQKS
jgi:hypothetical protein